MHRTTGSDWPSGNRVGGPVAATVGLTLAATRWRCRSDWLSAADSCRPSHPLPWRCEWGWWRWGRLQQPGCLCSQWGWSRLPSHPGQRDPRLKPLGVKNVKMFSSPEHCFKHWLYKCQTDSVAYGIFHPKEGDALRWRALATHSKKWCGFNHWFSMWLFDPLLTESKSPAAVN